MNANTLVYMFYSFKRRNDYFVNFLFCSFSVIKMDCGGKIGQFILVIINIIFMVVIFLTVKYFIVISVLYYFQYCIQGSYCTKLW